MGLDNYPATYPCVKQNTVVKDAEGLIDCEATGDCGGCPWKEELGHEPGRVLGMLGAPCWYRGKWGNGLMVNLGVSQSYFGSFYGDEQNSVGNDLKSPMSCLASASLMEEALQEMKEKNNVEEDFENDVIYAIKWLRWVAEYGDGAIAWA